MESTHGESFAWFYLQFWINKPEPVRYSHHLPLLAASLQLCKMLTESKSWPTMLPISLESPLCGPYCSPQNHTSAKDSHTHREAVSFNSNVHEAFRPYESVCSVQLPLMPLVLMSATCNSEVNLAGLTTLIPGDDPALVQDTGEEGSCKKNIWSSAAGTQWLCKWHYWGHWPTNLFVLPFQVSHHPNSKDQYLQIGCVHLS